MNEDARSKYAARVRLITRVQVFKFIANNKIGYT